MFETITYEFLNREIKNTCENKIGRKLQFICKWHILCDSGKSVQSPVHFGKWRILCDNAKFVQPPLLTPPKVVGRIQIGLIILWLWCFIVTFVNGSIYLIILFLSEGYRHPNHFK